MSTYTNLEKEQLAGLVKHDQRRVNTLGADGRLEEEPFSRTVVVFRNDIYDKIPEATDFADPNYKDFVDGDAPGVIGTRYENLRLHSLVTSGKSGNSSIQTFIAVRSAPSSDSYADIEPLRITKLIPSDKSLGRSHAAESNEYFRGFELALYPAKDNGFDVLVADTDRLIPITADPGAIAGAGDNDWSVDYADGVVRLSVPPLNGPTGLFNYNNVFGDINGDVTAEEDGGRITLFATFYEYTGTVLRDPELVTVGDGDVSLGLYYGDGGPGIEDYAKIMQQAVDSVSFNGGTVFVKEGNYIYKSTVYVPSNVNIVGLSKGAIITRINPVPAFSVYGSNVSISGLTISSGITIGGSNIELKATANSEEEGGSKIIKNIKINNTILSTKLNNYTDSAIIFSGNTIDCVFKQILISENEFNSSASSPYYIGNYNLDENIFFEHVYVDRNYFGVCAGGSPLIDLSGSRTELDNIGFSENHSDNATHVVIKNTRGLFFKHNIGLDLLCLENLLDSFVCKNKCAALNFLQNVSGTIVSENLIDGYINIPLNITKTSVSDNIINAYVVIGHSLSAGVSAHNLIIKNNTIGGNTTIGKLTESIIESNIFGINPGSLVDISNMSKTIMTNNKFRNDSGTSLDSIYSCFILSNTFSKSVIIDGYAQGNSDIFNNSFENTLELNGYSSYLNIRENTSSSSLLIHGRIDRTTISNNIFSSISIDNTSASTKNDIDIIGNKITTTLLISGTSNTYRVRLIDNWCDDIIFSVSNSLTEILISKNIILGTIDTNYTSSMLAYSLIDGNCIYHDLDLGAMYGTSIINNTCQFSDFIMGNCEDCIIDGNKTSGGLIINGEILRTTVSNNLFYSLLANNNTDTKDNFVVTNNIIDGNFTISGVDNSLENSKIIGNYITNALSLENVYSMLNVKIYDNNIVSSSNVGGSNGSSNVDLIGNKFSSLTIGTLTDSNISKNSISLLTCGGLIATSFNNNIIQTNAVLQSITSTNVNSNVFKVLFSLSGASTRSTISNNKMFNFYAAIIDNSSVISNQILNSTDIDQCTESTVDSNFLHVSIDIGQGTRNVFSDNYVSGTISFATTSSMNQLRIINNQILSGSTVSFGVNAGSWSVNDIIFSNNIVGGSVEIKSITSADNFVFETNKISGTFVSNTIMPKTKITNNRFQSTFSITKKVENGNFEKNIFEGNVTFSEQISKTAINENNFSGTLTLNDNTANKTEILICNNIFQTAATSMTISGASYSLWKSIISGNDFYGSVTFQHIDSGIISKNIFNSSVVIVGTNNKTIISNNACMGDWTIGGSPINTTISDNDFYSLNFNGGPTQTITHVSITGNNFTKSGFNTSLTIDSGNATNIVIANNTIQGRFYSISAISQGTITGNRFESSADYSTLSGTTMTGNNNLYLQLTISDVTSSSIKGNTFLCPIVITNALYSSICDNNFSNYITFSTAIREIKFNNNICELYVTFGATTVTPDPSNEFLTNTINGNTFKGNVTFGASAIPSTFSRMIFCNNIGSGNLIFISVAATPFINCSIIGNIMGAFTSPVSINVPQIASTNTLMLALNQFSAYTNITFAAAAILGWDNNDYPASSPVPAIGSINWVI